MKRAILATIVIAPASIGARAGTRTHARVTPEQIREAIGKLADFDYPTRMGCRPHPAPRPRRASGAGAVAGRSAEHADGLHPLSSALDAADRILNDPRTVDTMEAKPWCRRTIRLREVAYAYLEYSIPVPRAGAENLLAALDKEEGEFVRPALDPGAGRLCRHDQVGGCREDVSDTADS